MSSKQGFKKVANKMDFQKANLLRGKDLSDLLYKIIIIISHTCVSFT
jgi:hypothetical protein